MMETGMILTVAPQLTKTLDIGYPFIWAVTYNGFRWWRLTAKELGKSLAKATLNLSYFPIGSASSAVMNSTSVVFLVTTSPSKKLGCDVDGWNSADKTWTMLISMLSRTEGPIWS
ncbi:hypothetical protein ACFX2J_043531 [Malus domestica]